MFNLNLDIVVIIILIIYFTICVFKKISSKITFIISIIFLVIAAGFLMLEDQDLANDIVTIVYYLLIVSIALVVVEYIRDIRKSKEGKEQEKKP